MQSIKSKTQALCPAAAQPIYAVKERWVVDATATHTYFPAKHATADVTDVFLFTWSVLNAINKV